MTPLAPNRQVRDPRIVSPEIKVIFPSQSAEKDQQVSSESTSKPAPQVLPTVTAIDPVPVQTKMTDLSGWNEATQQIKSLDNQPQANSTKAPTWIDHVKEHAGLFLIASLTSGVIGLLIGIFIAKKR